MSAYEDLNRLLLETRLGVGVAEVHGSLCGWLCAGAPSRCDNWLEALQFDSTIARQDALQEALAERSRCLASELASQTLHLSPWLAATDAVEEQALGLVDWCRGFLGGYGLGGEHANPTGEAAILGDLAAIAHTAPEFGDAEEDRTALAELTGHVRFAAQWLYREGGGNTAEPE